jgi:hypothetical protein
MYIVIDKTTQNSAIIKEKTTLSNYINVSLSTIYRNKDVLCWNIGNFIVYKPQTILIKSNRGGVSNFKSKNDLF